MVAQESCVYQPLDLTIHHQDPPSSPLDLSVRKGIFSPADTEGRSGRSVSFTHLSDNDMHPSTDDDDSVQNQSSTSEILSDDLSTESNDGKADVSDDDPGGSLDDSEINVVDVSLEIEIPILSTPSGQGRKRKMVTSTPSSSFKRAKITGNLPVLCGKCGAPKKNHKKEKICPADFEIPNNPNARILEILERYYWRDRVFPRDNLVQPFYYRVRWSVKGEREFIPHGKLLDYCTKETLDSFNRRFCRDCGLESGTNPETGHSCPAEFRNTPPTKSSEFYIKKLVERHYWPDCADRKKEDSSFFKVEWSHPGQPEYVPSSWMKTMLLNKNKSDLLFYFGKKHRL